MTDQPAFPGSSPRVLTSVRLDSVSVVLNPLLGSWTGERIAGPITLVCHAIDPAAIDDLAATLVSDPPGLVVTCTLPHAAGNGYVAELPTDVTVFGLGGRWQMKLGGIVFDPAIDRHRLRFISTGLNGSRHDTGSAR